MLIDWYLAAVVAAPMFAYVLFVHWQALLRAWPARTLSLSGARLALVQWLRLGTETHLETLQGTLRVARADHEQGHTGAALHVVDQADKLAAQHVGWLRAWLQRWADVAAVMALSPATAPPAGSTQLVPVRRLAAAQRAGAALLPTRALRFRANVRLQRLALKYAGWNAGAARLRARHPDQFSRALDELEATHADLVALDSQVLATLEHLLDVLPPDEPLRPR